MKGFHNPLKEICAARDPARPYHLWRLDPCRCLEWASHRAEGVPHRCMAHESHEWGARRKADPAPPAPNPISVMRSVELLEAALRRMRA